MRDLSESFRENMFGNFVMFIFVLLEAMVHLGLYRQCRSPREICQKERKRKMDHFNIVLFSVFSFFN